MDFEEILGVWTTAVASLCYCYGVKTVVGQRTARLLLLLPVICLFFYLPLRIHSLHFGGPTAFFLAWLANFKLLLLAFHQGPLCTLRLPFFLALALLPIDLPNPKIEIRTREGPHTYAAKFIVLVLLVRVYVYVDSIPQRLIPVIYMIHVYVLLETILISGGLLARLVLGVELQPQFDEPYLSTSLQDFWGRRWNLSVTRILRPAVYEPTLRLAVRCVGRRMAPFPAVIAAFAVSGAMHEVMFVYLARTTPSFELTCFFLLHGVCLAVEIAVKRWLGERVVVPPMAARVVTMAFVMVTAAFLFLPPFCRAGLDLKMFDEYALVRAWGSNLVKQLHVFWRAYYMQHHE